MFYLKQRLLNPLKIAPLEEKAEAYKPQYKTSGHRVLDEDRRAENVSSFVIEKLDSVIKHVQSEVKIRKVTTIEDAISILRQIEQVVTTENFICSIPYHLISSFSQGLMPRDIEQRLAYSSENDLRQSHILTHAGEKFFTVDCDLSSLLYLCIGEVLNIPLRMVEVPDHNFIRWRLDDNKYVNWDTNYGFNKFTDSDYAAQYGVTPELIVNGTFLIDLSSENVEGYFCFIRAITFESSRAFPEAVNEYRTAIKKYPHSPAARNNLAWLFASNKSVHSIIAKEEALELALKACNIHRVATNLDTLACVYAECGNFKEAVQIETEAFAMNPSPDYQKMIEAFQEGKTWLDVQTN
ncbi:hypothetical protein [Microcoleus sp. K4-B3]|uniref:hypothetical protein n=1 Tax=Microcoleus sp. K4-B3 TaxID=2818791 RepID=UPI002FD24A31